MKLVHIKEFKFNKAQYNLTDTDGIKVILNVDYKNNKFSITAEKTLNCDHEQEIKEAAKDLLARKHGKNFAE